MIIVINNSNRNESIRKYTFSIRSKNKSKKRLIKGRIIKSKKIVNKKFHLYITDSLLKKLRELKVNYKNILSYKQLLDVINSDVKVSGVIIGGSELKLSTNKIPKSLLLPSIKAIEYYHKKVPIMGICFGFQIINNYFGGKISSLYSFVKQEKKVEFINTINNKNSIVDKHYNGEYRFLNGDKIEILGRDLVITSKNKTENIIYAIEHKNLPIYGFQFHPEISYNGIKLIRKFIDKTSRVN